MLFNMETCITDGLVRVDIKIAYVFPFLLTKNDFILVQNTFLSKVGMKFKEL